MSAWNFGETAPEATIEATAVTSCIFCGNELDVIRDRNSEHSGKRRSPGHKWYREKRRELVRRCQICGWWTVRHETDAQYDDHGHVAGVQAISGAAGCLKKLDLSDTSLARETVRDYLVAKYEDRFHLNPKVFEDVVGSVFRDLGYESTVTAYSGDDGLDVILTHSDGRAIGVQVKRYKNTIKVDQIRELAGALVLQGITEGIFVTTSRFTRGSRQAAERYKMRGHAIRLVDGATFLDRIKLAQTRSREEYDEIILNSYKEGLPQLKHEKWGGRHSPRFY